MAVEIGCTVTVKEEAYVYSKPNSNGEGERLLKTGDKYMFLGWLNEAWASVLTKHGLGYMLKR